MKKANESLLRLEYCCVEAEREQDRQGSERWWGRVGVGEASSEVERDEKEVDGVVHAEGDEVDDSKFN